MDVHHPSAKNPTENGFAILRSCLKGSSAMEMKYPLYSLERKSP